MYGKIGWKSNKKGEPAILLASGLSLKERFDPKGEGGVGGVSLQRRSRLATIEIGQLCRSEEVFYRGKALLE